MKDALKVIRTKQARWILGVSIRTARRLMNDVRNFFGKVKRAPVTILEFCTYFKYDVKDVVQLLKSTPSTQLPIKTASK